MSAILVIAGKELRDGLRNRWVVGAAMLMAALALALAFLGSAPIGEVKASRLAITVVSLSSLTIFLLPLIALLLSHDAIVGEIDRGTMALLLACPVSRPKALSGKFLGHLAVVTIATVTGYGAAGVAIVAAGGADASSLRAFAGLIASSVLLGAAFLAIGYLVSSAVRDRATAAAIALGVWLGFVLLYDAALLGVLVADHGRVLDARILQGLLLANPADAYRLLNLTGGADVSRLAGMAGLSADAQLSPAVLIGALILWIAAPLGLASMLFARRSL